MIKVLICGDYCPHDRVQEMIEANNFEDVFRDVQTYTTEADYSIVNLEAPVVESDAIQIDKCGPNLKCTSKAIKALKNAGFDMVTLANNHFYDYGEQGVQDTLRACLDNDIDVVGGGTNIVEASKILYKNIKGLEVAFINCCEHEFSIATDKTGGSNPLNPVQQFYAIQEAKRRASCVIVIVHGGHEHYQLPSPRMKELYRFFVDVGADAVINHHQHCYSGYEIYKEKPIFYGLGNFCFDEKGERNKIWNEGFMVMLSIGDNSVRHKVIPYYQGNESPGIVVSMNKKFENILNKLNEIIMDDAQLKDCHNQWMNTNSNHFRFVLEPYKGRYIYALYSRNLLPSFICKKKRLTLINYVGCESHIERLLYVLKNK